VLLGWRKIDHAAALDRWRPVAINANQLVPREHRGVLPIGPGTARRPAAARRSPFNTPRQPPTDQPTTTAAAANDANSDAKLKTRTTSSMSTVIADQPLISASNAARAAAMSLLVGCFS
jgi:hypothetical protein